MSEDVVHITVNLKITNNNDFVISDRYDAVPYEFKPGESTAVHADAALHIFGWFPGVDMAAVEKHVQKRWGWNRPELMMSGEAAERFKKLTFKAVSYKMVEVQEVEEIPDGDDVIPSPLKPRGKQGRVEVSA